MAIQQFTFGEVDTPGTQNDFFTTLNPPYYVNTCQAELTPGPPHG
jgi:hypothetical protein